MRIIKILGLLPLFAMMVSCGSDSPSGVDLSSTQPAADFIDSRDGKTYKCVQIGDQIWMAENLAYFPSGGTIDGCYTWNQSQYSLDDLEIDKDVFISLWRETVYDKDHNWTEEIKCTPAQLEMWLTMYYISGMFSQKEFMNNFSRNVYQPFMDLFKSRRTDYIMANLDEFSDVMISERDACDAENGGYSSKYGYLYSLEGAKKAVPEGWRLPTDADWIKLEKALGLSVNECEQMNAWRGEGIGSALQQGGESGFNVLMAGGNCYCGGGSNLFINLDECAYFWADELNQVQSGEDDESDDSGSIVVDEGVVRQFALYSSKVWRGTTRISTTRDVLYSVRCVKDVR